MLLEPPEAIVKAPKTRKARKGRGFSVGELADMELSIPQARKLNLRVDERRSSKWPENIEVLKTFLKQAEQKMKKRKLAKRKAELKEEKLPEKETKEK
ncbi:ribosomal protein L13e [Candidatus Bathyarchaeota archaeon]|nr:ribosomal protein L13e [Candidatus Bathyarchaeota archaeon]